MPTVFTYGVAMETVTLEHPTIEVFPAVESGYLRLSPQGLWLGEGTYTSPIVDLLEIHTLSGVLWNSEELYQTSINSTDNLPKTIELRYHDYYGPELNEAGYPHNGFEQANKEDPMWGDEGEIPWTPFENNYLASGIMIRYVQWRARFKGA